MDKGFSPFEINRSSNSLHDKLAELCRIKNEVMKIVKIVAHANGKLLFSVFILVCLVLFSRSIIIPSSFITFILKKAYFDRHFL